MGLKQQPSRLATVTKMPTSRRRGRPYKTLTSAVGRSASERDVLELLRRRLASRIYGDTLFVNNLVAWRVESRLAFNVPRPSAVCLVSNLPTP